jgi:hypothetical protein
LRFIYAPKASFRRPGDSMAITLTLVVSIAAVLLALAVVVVVSFGA